MPEIDISTYELKEITFDQIFPVWNEKLWPGRKSKIEPMSSLVWESRLFLSWGNSNINKDSSIFDKYEPTFFGLFLEKEKLTFLSDEITSIEEKFDETSLISSIKSGGTIWAWLSIIINHLFILIGNSITY